MVIDWPGGIVRRAAHRPSKTPTPFTVKAYSNRSRGMSSVPSFASRRSILNWAASSVLAVGLAPVVATRGTAPHPTARSIVETRRRAGVKTGRGIMLRILYREGMIPSRSP